VKDWVQKIHDGIGKLYSVMHDPMVYAVYCKLQDLEDQQEEFLVHAIQMFAERHAGLSKQLETLLLKSPMQPMSFIVGEKVLSEAEAHALMTSESLVVPPSLYGQVRNGGKCDTLLGYCECGAKHSRSEFAERLARNNLVMVIRQRSPFDTSK